MNVSKLKDIQAVIDSAKVRDDGKLEEFIRRTSPTSTDEEVASTAKVAVEVVEMVPIVLASAAHAARELGLTSVVAPILDHATRYFVNPVDLIPEMTQGMAGLLDDTYLTFRILENLNRGDPPLMEAEFDVPLRFLRRLLGTDVSDKLDDASVFALEDVAARLSRGWREVEHHS